MINRMGLGFFHNYPTYYSELVRVGTSFHIYYAMYPEEPTEAGTV